MKEVEYLVNEKVCPFCKNRLEDTIDDILGLPLDVYSCLNCKIDFFYTTDGLEIKLWEQSDSDKKRNKEV